MYYNPEGGSDRRSLAGGRRPDRAARQGNLERVPRGATFNRLLGGVGQMRSFAFAQVR